MNATKIKYLLTSIKKKFSNHADVCPFCASSLSKSTIHDSKMLVLQLKKCTCGLLVRTPTDSIKENDEFYQEEYEQGSTTDCPDPLTLKNYLDNNFQNTERDYSGYIKILQELNIEPGSKILDFGCSWGYGVYQFNMAGFNASGYEISKPRLTYGIENLGIQGVHQTEKIESDLDVFFSAHVLEHVPDLKFVFELANKLLKPGGYFIAITPNGSQAFRNNNEFNFHKLWGKVHPVLLTDDFVKNNLKNELKFLGSFPLNKSVKNIEGVHLEEADKWELLFCLQFRQLIGNTK